MYHGTLSCKQCKSLARVLFLKKKKTLCPNECIPELMLLIAPIVVAMQNMVLLSLPDGWTRWLVLVQADVIVNSIRGHTDSCIIRTIIIGNLDSWPRLASASTHNVYMSAIDIPLAMPWPVLDWKGKFQAEQVYGLF